MVTASSSSTTEHGLDVGGEIEILSLPEVAARPDDDASISEHRISIQETVSQCCRICMEEDTQGNLIELSCNCQGDLSRAHRVCILKWFGVRMWLKRNYACDLCNAPLHSIQQMVTIAMADNESRGILFEAIGEAIVPQAQEVPGPNVEGNGENPSQRAQNSAWSRIRNSDRVHAGVVYTAVIIMVIWFYCMVRWLIFRLTSSRS